MKNLSQLLVICSLFIVSLLIVGCGQVPSTDDAHDATFDGVNASNNTGCIEFANCPANNQTIFGSISSDLYRENISQGYFVSPQEPRAGVLLIHEWWGLNENIKLMADYLASEGYAVVAVDLYEGKIAQNASQAREYRMAYNRTNGIQTLQSAQEYLQNKGVAKVASMGWCFGGGESLAYSLSGAQLDATIVYYGTLTTQNVSQLTWPVLGVFGDQDQSISVESVRAFESALINNSVTHEIYMYEGVGHAFANPSNAGFAPEPTRDAWNKTLAFLEKTLN